MLIDKSYSLFSKVYKAALTFETSIILVAFSLLADLFLECLTASKLFKFRFFECKRSS